MSKREKVGRSKGGRSVTSREPARDAAGLPIGRIRRAPNVVAFLASGFIIGAIIGVFLSLGSQAGNYRADSATAYFFVLFGALGTLIGGIIFVFADRRSLSRTR